MGYTYLSYTCIEGARPTHTSQATVSRIHMFVPVKFRTIYTVPWGEHGSLRKNGVNLYRTKPEPDLASCVLPGPDVRQTRHRACWPFYHLFGVL